MSTYGFADGETIANNPNVISRISPLTTMNTPVIVIALFHSGVGVADPLPASTSASRTGSFIEGLRPCRSLHGADHARRSFMCPPLIHPPMKIIDKPPPGAIRPRRRPQERRPCRGAI